MNGNSMLNDDSYIPDDMDTTNTITSSSSPDCDTNKTSRSAALFLLSLKEKHRLTQTCIDYTVSQVQEMVTFIIDDLKSATEHSIQQQLADTHVELPDISLCFENINPFKGLETEHKQMKFYKDTFGLVVSTY